MKNLFTLILCLVSFLLHAQLTDGLIAWYPFDGDTEDSSGNNYHGTPINTNFTADRFGNPTKACFFDGNDDYIIVPDHAALRLANTDFTIAAWIRLDEIGTVGHTILNKRTGIGNQGYFFQVIGQNNPIVGHQAVLDFITSGGQDPLINSGSPIQIEEWTHVAVCFDNNSGIGKLFINGNQEAEGALYSPNSFNNATLLIGADNYTGEFFFNGAMDDIRIYNRKLSIDEIIELSSNDTNLTNNNQQESLIYLFPVPASNWLNIDVKGEQPVKFKMYDAAGSLKISSKFSNTLDVSGLPPGVYLLHFLDANNKTLDVKKFVKIRSNRV